MVAATPLIGHRVSHQWLVGRGARASPYDINMHRWSVMLRHISGVERRAGMQCERHQDQTRQWAKASVNEFLGRIWPDNKTTKQFTECALFSTPPWTTYRPESQLSPRVAGAAAGRPLAFLTLIFAMAEVKMALSTCLVKASAGLSVPKTLCRLICFSRSFS